MKHPRLNPPLNYAAVDSNIHRCSFPSELNFEFLKSLKLKTIITLSTANDSLVSFSTNHDISLLVLNECDGCKDQYDSVDSLEKFNDAPIVEALKLMLNQENHPVLITCRSGKLLCSLVIGCFRKVQNWSMLSIFEEFRRNMYGNARLQYCYEQYLESFDIDFLDIEIKREKN